MQEKNYQHPYYLGSRQSQKEDIVIDLGSCQIGGGYFAKVAGPCAVESKDQVYETARLVKEAGGEILRGGAFKPRTNPYTFQGLGEEGLCLLREAADAYDLKVVTEVMDSQDIPLVANYADILQVGARNMQNYRLLAAVGQQEKPVFLKRGLSATIEEWLSAAEYIAVAGNEQIALVERGIRTFETQTRNTFDVSAVPVVHHLSRYPVLIDPSHASGTTTYVEALTLAGIAAGADGFMIEIHPHPEQALSDGSQSLNPQQWQQLMQKVDQLLPLVASFYL